ncbi:hypothetical protein A0H81_10081 [Grifola frondosa]|uniref:Uncharacterized protein n=1 Tax=Grifola frondosa TaxID=5627 RepID=A0A1C7LYU9_GRIFR|nr:hypothetical protein A0H81_10081 [Grifola frondosa]
MSQRKSSTSFKKGHERARSDIYSASQSSAKRSNEQSESDKDHESDDEHTLTAYGDVSLTEEYIAPPSPSSPRSFRPKVSRPRMPHKRSVSLAQLPEPDYESSDFPEDFLSHLRTVPEQRLSSAEDFRTLFKALKSSRENIVTEQRRLGGGSKQDVSIATDSPRSSRRTGGTSLLSSTSAELPGSTTPESTPVPTEKLSRISNKSLRRMPIPSRCTASEPLSHSPNLRLSTSFMALDIDPDVQERVTVPPDSWKTSFRAISWAYGCKCATMHPRPPHYHDLLSRTKYMTAPEETSHSNIDLNPSLAGVQAAADSLREYEIDVAISRPDKVVVGEDAYRVEPVLFDGALDEEEVALAKKRWDETVQALLSGVLERLPSNLVLEGSPEMKPWDLTALETALDSPDAVDSTDSEQSVASDPPPQTPKPTKKSYARVVGPHGDPPVFSPLPSKLLNAAALTFIPSTPASVDPTRSTAHDPVTPPLTSSSHSSDSPFSSPTYEFHFPSLNPSPPADRARSLPPTLQKDEHGFYVEVGTGVTADNHTSTRSATPRRPSAAFLPAFLTDGSAPTRTRNSKTREIVDRLRSTAGTHTKSRKARRQSSISVPVDSVAIDSDGWISGPASEERTQDKGITDDGWVEGSTRKRGSHKRTTSNVSAAMSSSSASASVASPAASTSSLGAAAVPAARPTFYSAGFSAYASPLMTANPAMAQAAAYMQMHPSPDGVLRVCAVRARIAHVIRAAHADDAPTVRCEEQGGRRRACAVVLCFEDVVSLPHSLACCSS